MPKTLLHLCTHRRLVSRIFPCLAFALVLLWGWRVYDIINRIPAYGDALEVIWGIQQYHDALVNSHTLPLFTPLVFAPNGWHTATLAHTPFLFLLAQPFCFIGGTAFAYNVLVLASLLVAYAGSLKLLQRFTSLMPAVVGALVFTFIFARWFRIYGHLHILWATSFLPWLLMELVAVKHEDDPRQSRKRLILGGLIWGLMINFSYYSIFMAAAAFLVWGKGLFQLQYLKKAFVIALIAGILSAPILILYEVGSRLDGTSPWTIMGMQVWGASLNSLIDVSRSNPITILRSLSLAIYSGPVDESGVHQLGIVTGLLAILGTVFICWKDRRCAGLLWLVGGAFILSLGLLLKWNGQELSLPVLQPLDAFLWRVGHMLKPDIFVSQVPQPPFDTGIPLPGYVLAVLVPFFESARVVSRYALVGGLGLIVIAAIGLDRVPVFFRWFLAIIWVLEGIPAPTGVGVPITTLEPHPAYAWLASQSLADGENTVDIAYPTIAIGGEIIYATLFHHKPTVSGVGSYLPQHARYLFDHLVLDTMQNGGEALKDQAFIRLLNQYGVRYALFHLRDVQSKEMWNLVRQNPQMHTIQCFDPNPGPSPWRYPICVAEILPQPVNIITADGWQPSENWGIWAKGMASQAEWVATAQVDYRLNISAFPYCSAQETTVDQEIQFEVNGTPLLTHTWTRCEVWSETITIPKSMVKMGQNDMVLRYTHATRPSESEPGNGDTRQLSVGFTRLNIQRK